MQKTFEDPFVLSVARRDGFLKDLVDANDKLDTIQKGLNDYLETKRLVSLGDVRIDRRGSCDQIQEVQNQPSGRGFSSWAFGSLRQRIFVHKTRYLKAVTGLWLIGGSQRVASLRGTSLATCTRALP